MTQQDDLLGTPAHLSIDGQIACIEREIRMRKRVYPRWVGRGRMTQAKADQELETMRAVLVTLRTHLLTIERERSTL